MKRNAENERVKRSYVQYLKEAVGRSGATIDQALRSIDSFEDSTRRKSFKAFHIEQAKAWKRGLAETPVNGKGRPLSVATRRAMSRHVQAFFRWLAGRPGYRSCFVYADAEYFNLSESDNRIADAQHPRAAPTEAQILAVLAKAPAGTDIELRDRALIAFVYLTGARDGAVIGFKLKHVDLKEGLVRQDARDVATKFSKSFPTWFLPVPGLAREIVTDWVRHLSEVLGFGRDDPLFPATDVTIATRRFAAVGLKRAHWRSAGPVRQIFRDAFARAGLPYFNPHSIRKTLGVLGTRLCQTPEQLKAWSQNLGHEDVMTTLRSYGAVAPERQAELIRGLATRREGNSDADPLRQIEGALVQLRNSRV